MNKEDPKALATILAETTTEGMKEAAQKYGLLADGKIDLRERKVRFRHSGLDLGEFLLEGADLSSSILTNCTGEGVSFRRCGLRKAQIVAEKAKKVSFRMASFDEAVLVDAELGPRTLDLTQTTFRNATLSEVTFNMPKLEEADFTGASLKDVYFRNGLLRGASFRNARLARVSFERASLEGADFTGASFQEMDYWGEPNWEGAIIADDLRYQYGELAEPRRKVEALIERGDLGPEATEALRRLRERYAVNLSYPEAMFVAREMTDAVPLELFPKIMKALKSEK